MVKRAEHAAPRREFREDAVQPQPPIEAPADLARMEPCHPDDTAPKKKPPAFQFYAKDWLASPAVRSMTLAEVGAYINLLATAWDSDPVGTLPNRAASLWRLAGAASPQEWESVSHAVLANFEAQGDRLVNRRLQEVYQELVRHSEEQRGRANKRWDANRKGPGTASAPRSESPGTGSAYAGSCSSTATAPATATASATAITEKKESVPSQNQWASHSPNLSNSGTAADSDSDAASRLLDYFRSVSGQQAGDIVDFRQLLKNHPADLIQPMLFWAFKTSNYWRKKLRDSRGFRNAFKAILKQFKNYQATTLEHGGQAAVDRYLRVANDYGQAPDPDDAADESEGGLDSAWVIDGDGYHSQAADSDRATDESEGEITRSFVIEEDTYGEPDDAADESEGDLNDFVIEEDNI